MPEITKREKLIVPGPMVANPDPDLSDEDNRYGDVEVGFDEDGDLRLEQDNECVLIDGAFAAEFIRQLEEVRSSR